MRIGIDAHSVERDGSGNCTYMRGLLRGLLGLDRENSYILYAIDKNHRFYGELGPDPRILVRALGVRNPLLRIPLFLAGATCRDRLDILHVQYISPPRHCGKLVVTIHDLGFLHYPRTFSRLEAFRSRFLVPRAARAAAKVITGSSQSQSDIVASLGIAPHKVEIIPYGVSPSFTPERDRDTSRAVLRKYGLRTPYILCVGRLNPRKNLAALGEAFSLVKRRQAAPHTLVIVGKNDFGTGEIVRSMRRTVRDDILFTGFVTDEDLPHLYGEAEVFVYPSLFEGFGLPVIEAMASGVPVITSDTPSLRETAGDAAVTVSALNVEELASAISRLLGDVSLRSELAARGLARARGFTWTQAARKTLDVYRELASRG